MRPIVIHCRANNDASGNPRRVFVALDPATGSIVRTFDEGYDGRAPVDGAFGGRDGWIESIQIDIGPSEYRALVRFDHVHPSPVPGDTVRHGHNSTGRHSHPEDKIGRSNH